LKEVKLLQTQIDFVSDIETPFIGFVGGYRSGKTYSLCHKALYMANINHMNGALLEPTYGMITKVLIPTMMNILYELDIHFNLNKSDGYFDITFDNEIKRIWLLSAENYSRAAGMSLSWFGIDEMDTMKLHIATNAWNMMVSRLTDGNHMQGFSTSTPEGFNFLYKFFEEEADDDRRLIRAKTCDNPFISEDYIKNLRATHTELQCEAYLNGKFVNFNEGNVYYNFDRDINHIDGSIDDYPNHYVHVGQDFNVNNCASTISIVDKNKVYCLDEISCGRDTYDIIATLNERYPGREFIIYPDASGNDGFKTAISDVALFKQAGFQVKAKTKNPFIKDRVQAVNTKFKNSNGDVGIFINTIKCPSLTKTLEQQGYDKGSPDKGNGLDHMGDAFGYFVWYLYPVKTKARLITG
jgi:hypothetical protein